MGSTRFFFEKQSSIEIVECIGLHKYVIGTLCTYYVHAYEVLLRWVVRDFSLRNDLL